MDVKSQPRDASTGQIFQSTIERDLEKNPTELSATPPLLVRSTELIVPLICTSNQDTWLPERHPCHQTTAQHRIQ